MAYPVKLLFDLVADVESYPQFLPFWRDARIVRSEKNLYYTEQSIGIGPLSDRFQTKTRLEPLKHIVVTPYRAERQFKHFLIEWWFEEIEADLTKVQLTFDVEPNSLLLRRLADALTREAAQGMLSAFERRANSRYS